MNLDCESEAKSEIKEHFKQGLQCKNVGNLDNFGILKKCLDRSSGKNQLGNFNKKRITYFKQKLI